MREYNLAVMGNLFDNPIDKEILLYCRCCDLNTAVSVEHDWCERDHRDYLIITFICTKCGCTETFRGQEGCSDTNRLIPYNIGHYINRKCLKAEGILNNG